MLAVFTPTTVVLSQLHASDVSVTLLLQLTARSSSLSFAFYYSAQDYRQWLSLANCLLSVFTSTPCAVTIADSVTLDMLVLVLH